MKKLNDFETLMLTWMILITASFFSFFCLAWNDTLKTNTPAGTDDPREADDRMREIKGAFVERLDVDHYWTASATSTYDATDTGKHEFITLIDMASDPTAAAGYAHIYMKGDELFYQDDTDTTCQITKDGQVEYQSISDVNNNTYIKAVDAAGTGTVNLIKADANDEQILPDGIRLETDGAPVQDEDVANKKYVDDQITAQGDTRYARGWAYVNAAGSVLASFNVSGVVRNSAGNYTVSWDTDFSSVNYCVVATSYPTATEVTTVCIVSQAVGTTQIKTYKDFENAVAADAKFHVVAFGAQ